MNTLELNAQKLQASYNPKAYSDLLLMFDPKAKRKFWVHNSWIKLLAYAAELTHFPQILNEVTERQCFYLEEKTASKIMVRPEEKATAWQHFIQKDFDSLSPITIAAMIDDAVESGDKSNSMTLLYMAANPYKFGQRSLYNLSEVSTFATKYALDETIDMLDQVQFDPAKFSNLQKVLDIFLTADKRIDAIDSTELGFDEKIFSNVLNSEHLKNGPVEPLFLKNLACLQNCYDSYRTDTADLMYFVSMACKTTRRDHVTAKAAVLDLVEGSKEIMLDFRVNCALIPLTIYLEIEPHFETSSPSTMLEKDNALSMITALIYKFPEHIHKGRAADITEVTIKHAKNKHDPALLADPLLAKKAFAPIAALLNIQPRIFKDAIIDKILTKGILRKPSNADVNYHALKFVMNYHGTFNGRTQIHLTPLFLFDSIRKHESRDEVAPAFNLAVTSMRPDAWSALAGRVFGQPTRLNIVQSRTIARLATASDEVCAHAAKIYAAAFSHINLKPQLTAATLEELNAVRAASPQDSGSYLRADALAELAHVCSSATLAKRKTMYRTQPTHE